MKQLSTKQGELVSSLVQRLGAIDGIRAVVLGGSYARGRARPGSDIDLYVFSPAELLAAVESVSELFRETVALTDGLYQPRFTLPK
jgi:predicted nucleotidyltransferase